MELESQESGDFVTRSVRVCTISLRVLTHKFRQARYHQAVSKQQGYELTWMFFNDIFLTGFIYIKFE